MKLKICIAVLLIAGIGYICWDGANKSCCNLSFPNIVVLYNPITGRYALRDTAYKLPRWGRSNYEYEEPDLAAIIFEPDDYFGYSFYDSCYAKRWYKIRREDRESRWLKDAERSNRKKEIKQAWKTAH